MDVLDLPIFIISMAEERCERVRAELKAAIPPANGDSDFRQVFHIHGVDGSDPFLRNRSDVSYLASFFCPDKTLGCALAHRKVAREIIERDVPAALILEDDVVVTSVNLPHDLRRILHLETDGSWENGTPVARHDAVRLFCQGICCNCKAQPYATEKFSSDASYAPQCCHPLIASVQGSSAAYLLFRRGAEKLSSLPVTWHVDVELNDPLFDVAVGPSLFTTLDDRSQGPIILGQALSFWMMQPLFRIPLFGNTIRARDSIFFSLFSSILCLYAGLPKFLVVASLLST